MRALVAILFMGVVALVACNKNDGGGGGAATPSGPAGYATTPQACSISTYTGGMCTNTQMAIVMPGAWPLSAAWSFPNPWNAQAYSCGCPRTTVSIPGQPAFQQEQLGVFFPASSTVACAPVGYFQRGDHMYVGNVNALLQVTAQMAVNPGSQAGFTNPYMVGGYAGATGYGTFYGANNGYANFYGVNNSQMYNPYGTGQMGITDRSAAQCLNRMVIGCDLALEQRLRMYGQSQCNGAGQCIPAVPNQPQSTLGYCSFGSPF